MTILTVSANTIGTHIGDNTTTTDTYLDQQNPASNFGTITTMFVTDGATSNSKHVLIEFAGLSAIPAGATINSVTIYFWRQGSNTPSMSVDFYALLRALNETTATWNTYDGATSWTTAGGTGSGTDISATLSGTMTIGNASQFYSLSSAQLATDVGNGVTKWLVKPNNPVASGASRTIVTREGTDGFRPAIVVDYTAAGGTPVAGSDGLAVKLVDTSAVVMHFIKTVTESLAVKLVESPVSNIYLETTDTFAVKMVEIGNISGGSLITKNRTETFAIKLFDSGAIGGPQNKAVTEALAIKLLDSGYIYNPGAGGNIAGRLGGVIF